MTNIQYPISNKKYSREGWIWKKLSKIWTFDIRHLTLDIPRRGGEGFTFIELILYVALVSMFLATIVPFAWSIIEGSSKSTTQQEVHTAARYIVERLKYEIRSGADIDTANSTFNLNLATDSTRKLTLTQPAPTPVTIINVLNGKVQISQNGSPAVALNSTDTTVTDLTFSNFSSADNKTKHVVFTFSIASATDQTRQEFRESVSLRSSAELRSN